jgi:hypothetical protein
MTAFADFPYPLVEAAGENALATWEELKKAGRGAPVVLGDRLEDLLFLCDLKERARQQPIEKILAAAEAMQFPQDLRKLRRDENARVKVALGLIASLGDYVEEEQTPFGEWPEEPEDGPGLSVAYDGVTDEPKSVVYIALIPTDDPTTIPAFMRWGDWNQCPAAAYHVAALRAWRDRYGAELIGLGPDTINLRVSRKPATREEALELAHEHYAYCSDIIVQGVGSDRALAGFLMKNDWWYFWWD